MCLPVLLFVTASALVCWLPVLPSIPCLLVGIPFAVGALFFARVSWLGATYLGLACAMVQGSDVLSRRLPLSAEGKDTVVTGRVVSLPQAQDGIVRFRFAIEDCDTCWARGTVTLSAYPASGGHGFDPSRFLPGEKWRLTARMTRPRGTVNSGLFDYEGWMLSEGIVATGYVRADPGPVRMESGGLRQLHHRTRFWLREKIKSSLAGSRVAGLAVALAIGESNEIGSKDWQVLSDTGTNHLLIISGLHVGLVAGASYKLMLLALGRLVSTPTRWAGGFSLFIACLYGALAGMGLPVQRALVMTAVALLGVVFNRNIPIRNLFCLALLAVTLLDPFAALRAGFWLSFGAVFVLIYSFAGRIDQALDWRLVNWFMAALRSQWVVFAGMFPLLIALVHQISLVAFFVNLVAIPWVSLTVIPALLLAIPALAAGLAPGHWLLVAADISLGILWQFLSWAAALDFVYFQTARITFAGLSLALAGVAILLLPRGIVMRWPGFLLLLPLLTAHHEPLPPRAMQIDVVDVGQGLAVIVRSASHTLLYDAGPRFGDRFDAGERIVTPLLRLGGASRAIDTLVLSHSDLDHAGGVGAITANFLVGEFFANELIEATPATCRDDHTFSRDQIDFTFFSLAEGRDNDRSCVLLIRSGSFALLLPGDIEAEGEAHLLTKSLPPIDVLVVPHHGSKSSSGPGFINHTRAAHAIFPTGYRNRFGHPDPNVLARYHSRQIKTWNTADDGGIRIVVSADGHYAITAARHRESRFWYDARSESGNFSPWRFLTDYSSNSISNRSR